MNPPDWTSEDAERVSLDESEPCEHTFVEHIGIRIAAGTLRAWLPVGQVENVGAFRNAETHPRMLRCTDCGEQGYEVPA